MIRINDFVINEKLIKAALPYHVPPKEGVVGGFPGPCTKIIFVDNSELVFQGMDIYQLFNELEKINK